MILSWRQLFLWTVSVHLVIASGSRKLEDDPVKEVLTRRSRQTNSRFGQTPASQGKTGSIVLNVPRRPQISLRNFNNINVRSGTQAGIRSNEIIKTQEQSLIDKKMYLAPNTPARGHGKQFKLKQSTREENDVALQVVRASQTIARELGLKPEQAESVLTQIPLRGSEFERFCLRTPRCNATAKFRTTNGECNNLQRPLFGRSNTPVSRILPAIYEDGVFESRKTGVNGLPLTNPRIIANTVLIDKNVPDQEFTLSVMQWAQFIDHDLALSPFTEFINGEGIECCPDKNMPTDPTEVFELCDPIPISSNDGFFARRGQFCMNFIRSMLAINKKCAFGPAEQIEVLTHWLDGSNIYGSDLEEIEAIRAESGGRLIVSGGNLLPFNPEGGECLAPLRDALCFIAGESRVQEQPALTVMHTIWHREHNRIANELGRINRHWDDERLFQEARRINIAQYQHIMYEEWLPIIIGPVGIQQLGLKGKESGFSFDYDPTIDPNTSNEFATAAFRFGHSLVVGVYRLISELGKISTIKLRDHFNTAHILQKDPRVLDMFIRALINQPIQTFDPFITVDLTNFLFQTPFVDFGMDLMTLNVQRGRDHAIVTYNSIREVCGLGRAKNFNDLTDTISPDLIRRLQLVYQHVDDIDLFIGGIIEKPFGGGFVGRTFACIIGDQFRRSRRGDRFFYDLGGQPGSFTPGQLQEIRKATWARVVCDNSDNVPNIQPQAFRLADTDAGPNKLVSCAGPAIPRINLQHFRG